MMPTHRNRRTHPTLILVLLLSLLYGSAEATTRARHQSDTYRHHDDHHRTHHAYHHDPYKEASHTKDDINLQPYQHDPYQQVVHTQDDHSNHQKDAHKKDPYTKDDSIHHLYQPDQYKKDPKSQDDTYPQNDPYASEYNQNESYEDDDPYQKEAIYQTEGEVYQKKGDYRQEGLHQLPAQLPPPSNYYHSPPPPLNNHHNPPPPLNNHHNPPPPLNSHHNPPPPLNNHHNPHYLLPQPLPSPIKIDFNNASSLSAYEELKARGTYLIGSGHEYPQPPRTWTAEPKQSYDDTTTRDPAIPENPEGLKNPSLLVGPWEEEPTVRITNAVFKGVNGSVVEAQLGTTAKIPCVILNRADHEMVSWIRLRDHRLITVGRQTYTNDERFSVTYNRHLYEWVLHLRYAQERDEGEYACQLSTHPPMVFISTLIITEASSEIGGGPERYVQEGSSVVLNCTLQHHTQPPEYVFWYHNRTMINFDTARKVSVRNTRDGSILTLAAVGRTDSGNYTCQPPNSSPASITLHIIAGDAPAAMQVSSARRTHPPTHHLLLWLLLLLFLSPGLTVAPLTHSS